MIQRRFYRAVKITLVSVYLIFIAGTVVRMTGSGMGCPDWPKCFGHYIPPTEEAQILWHPKNKYDKGMIIVHDKALYSAKQSFTSGLAFDSTHWEPYTQHDYATFNVFHTWTEYINRLTSVISGFVFIWLLYCALRYRKKSWVLTFWCFFAFFLMLFEAWMGKKVVDTVLKPKIITAHMVIGLFIIQILIGLLHKLRVQKSQTIVFRKSFLILLWAVLCCSLLQIATGTQVRQFVDEQIQLWGFGNKEMRLYQPNFNFYFHRSFTILVVLLNFWVFIRAKKNGLYSKIPLYVMMIIFVEALTGILMYYVEFPMGTQSIHFITGIIMFGLQSYLVWDYQPTKRQYW